MRNRLALTATIVTGAAAALVGLPASASAFPVFPPCGKECDIVVNSTADLPDADPGDGHCAAANGACTLRAAVQEGNARRNKPPYQVSIKVPRGHYTLTRHGLDDTAARGDLDLHLFGEIVGAGQSRTIVDGDGADRVFDLHSDSERIAHLTVRNGRATDGPGGGIRAVAMDGLEYLNVLGNEAAASEAADSGKGGGIAGFDTFVAYSTVEYNKARDGAGMWWHGAQTNFSSDTFAYNHAAQDGGGLLYESNDSYFTNLTITGNTAGDHGGGIALRGPANGSFFYGSASTIASNTASAGHGGGIWRGAGGDSSSTLTGDIVAKNAGGDCGGTSPLTDNGGNLDGDGTCFGVAGGDPKLGGLAYNGGPTPTRAPLAGSPAIDRWNCSDDPGYVNPGVDQRGAKRPQGDGCDAGAYEAGACCPAFEPPYKSGSGSGSGSGGLPGGPGRTYCGRLQTGTQGADTLVGDEFRNLIEGYGGDDRIYGLGQSDCLIGGLGKDLILGAAGSDVIFGNKGADRLSGGDDEDLIVGNSGNDRISGGADDDRLIGSRGKDTIRGGDGYDIIRAGPGNDKIDGRGKGLDTIDCGTGVDRVIARRGEKLFRCEKVKLVP